MKLIITLCSILFSIQVSAGSPANDYSDRVTTHVFNALFLNKPSMITNHKFYQYQRAPISSLSQEEFENISNALSATPYKLNEIVFFTADIRISADKRTWETVNVYVAEMTPPNTPYYENRYNGLATVRAKCGYVTTAIDTNGTATGGVINSRREYSCTVTKVDLEIGKVFKVARNTSTGQDELVYHEVR